MNLILFFDKLNKIPLYLLLFLVPIFFLPFTQSVLDFPKQILALVLILLSFIGWLSKNIFEGNLVIRKNKIFYLALLIVFLSLLLSAIFSLMPRQSLLGSPLAVVDNLVTFLLFFIFAFLIVNSFKKEKEIIPFLFFFILGGAIAALLNLFQMYRIFPLPFEFARRSSFNTIGTSNSLALFSSVLLPLSLILTFNSKGLIKTFLAIVSALFFLNLILINFRTAWVVLAVAILFIFIFGFTFREKRVKVLWLSLLMIGLVSAVFFYFFPMRLPGFPDLSPEVSLTFNSETYILREAFNEGPKNILLGTGPGTFIFSYSKYRSPLLNQTLFWGTRFMDGHSSFLDWVLTKGILGGFALVFLYAAAIILLFKDLIKSDNKNFYEIKLGLAAGTLGIICASFLYTFNFTLYFTLFLFVAAFILFCSSQSKRIDLSSHLKVVSANLILILVIVASLGLIFFHSQKYFAEIKYFQAIQASQEEKFEQAIDDLERAITLNSSLDVYWRDLSQLYLTQPNRIAENINLSDEQKRNLINAAIIEGANTINQAIAIGPANVANWNVRGFFYRSLIEIEGAAELAIASYSRAVELEPASPFPYGEKARVYILMAQKNAQKGEHDKKQENLNLAINNLDQAIRLKPDYAPAHYLLAIAYDQKGEIDQAIVKLEETKNIVPNDIGISFQLGLLYWRKDRLEEAVKEFENVIVLNPDYANARYMLGMAYDRKGEKDKALEQFRIVYQLDSESEEIKEILEKIEQGLPVSEEVILPEPVVEETPPEIQ